MPWDPQQYLQFQQERFLPFDDLLALVDRRAGMRVVDLGCGTGELTARLAGALPGSEVLGIDSSAEMLEKAASHAEPNLRFERASIESIEGEWDLVFSHAAIHWVDNHWWLVPRLLSLVRVGGQLAVQLPANFCHPSQVIMRETAHEAPFREALGGWTREIPILEIDQYAELLYESGGRDLTVLARVYPHVLEDADAIAEWMAGTALVPYFERLPDDLQKPFMERFRQRLRAKWPQSPVFFGFRRILFHARREP